MALFPKVANYIVSERRSVLSNSLRSHRLYSPWNSPDRSFLQGIFPTQRLNPGLPHCRRTLHQLIHKGSPLIILVFNKCYPDSPHQTSNGNMRNDHLQFPTRRLGRFSRSLPNLAMCQNLPREPC